MGWIRFNGKSSTDFSTEVFIQKKPDYEFPEKDVEFISIPGRSGDLIIDHNRYKNIEKTYYIASVVHGYNEENQNGNNFIKQAALLVQWLKNTKGYGILEDSYDKNVYRKAIYVEESVINDIYDGAAALELIFNCKPQRYFTWGDLSWTFPKSSFGDYHTGLDKWIYPYEIPGYNQENQILHEEVSEESLPKIIIQLNNGWSGENEHFPNIHINIGNGKSIIKLAISNLVAADINGKNLIFDSETFTLVEENEGTNYTYVVSIEGSDPMMYLQNNGGVKGTHFRITTPGTEGDHFEDYIDQISIIPRWWKL